MSFLKTQFEKEKVAGKNIWRKYLKGVIIFWGFLGILCIFSPAWPIGIILTLGAIYVFYRIKPKNKIRPEK